MIYANPTIYGTGIEIWGDYEDLANLYNTMDKLMMFEAKGNSAIGRCYLISTILQEIRHCIKGHREIENKTDNNNNNTTYYGFKVDWITLLYTISALRYNAALISTDNLDQCNLYQLEYWTSTALEKYDFEGARYIKLFINARIDITSEYIYPIYQNVLSMYLTQKPSKKRFRNITNLITSMSSGEKLTDFITEIRLFMLTNECSINDIEIGKDIPIIKW